MTRINDHLLVQRVDDLIVLVDESTGAEITFPISDGVAVAASLIYFVEPARQEQP